MLLLLIAVSGMLITQHFAQLASMPQGHQPNAAVQALAQHAQQRSRSQQRQDPSDSSQRSTQGAYILPYQTRRMLRVRVAMLQSCAASLTHADWTVREAEHGCRWCLRHNTNSMRR